jgi:cysteinyl-tRNA synthetase
VGRIEEKPKNGRGRHIELSQGVCEILRSHREAHGGHDLMFVHHRQGYARKFQQLDTS